MAAKRTTRRRATTAKPDPEPQPTPGDGSYRDIKTYQFLFVLAALLALIAWIGVNTLVENRVAGWFQILALMTAFAVVLGRAVTGRWRGILINGNYRMSLSRLQILAWSMVILSALLTAGLSNLDYDGWSSALNIEVPSELWVVMGISTASLVAAPAVLGTKQNKKADPAALKKIEDEKIDVKETSVVLKNKSPEDARWADLMKGEEVGNWNTVDMGKMQMFFFTFILVTGYAAAIAAMFRGGEPIMALPPVDDGMNVLLGISHTGYLASKTVTYTKEK